VVPAVVAVLAIVYPGAPVSQVELDDGAVWLTNGNRMLLGRYNPQVEELNAGLAGSSPDLDVLQDAGSVLLVEPGSVSVVDPASVTVAGSAPVPTGARVSMAAGVVSVLDGDGALWVDPLDEVGSLDTTTAPDLDLGPGGGAVVARGTGTVLAVAADGSVQRADLRDGAVRVVDGAPLAEAPSEPIDQVTAVGDRVVVLAGSRLYTSSAVVDLASYGGGPVVQQPGPSSDTVLVATQSALLEVPLDGDVVVEHPSGGSGVPAAPVRVAGCGHAAWATATGSYLKLCGGRADVLDLERMTTSADLVFRVNRDVVVLNDVGEGLLWVPTQDPQVREPNWQDVEPDEPDEQGDQSTEQRATRNLETECTPQSAPPQAADDDYGVRPGRTTVLSVIDNDVASDCGILAITELDALDPAFGTLAPVYGGRAVQLVTAPDASGTVEFTYTVTDGRGSSAPSTATVRLTVRPVDENAAPVQVRTGQLAVETGATARYDVLADFVDPDGDLLVLVGASVAGGGATVRTREDGQLTFRADDGALGRVTVGLLVSDGTLVTEGQLQVDVRPAGSLVPVIDPVHAETKVGETVTVRPLDSVRSASREPVRLAAVAELAGATIKPDLTAGTFTFSAGSVGTYYVSFTVTAAPQQATGIARIDVTEAPSADTRPTAVLDVALLPQGGEVVIDPTANDVDPLGGVLVLQSVDVPAGSGLEIAVLGQRLARISSSRVLEGSVSVPYTVSNGITQATGEIRVKPIEASATQQPPVVPDVTVSVRTGGVVTIPVLEDAYDPDGDTMTVLPTLAEPLAEGQGLLFVSGDVLRYQAPETPMRVTATFEVSDSAGNQSSATVTVDVHASNPEGKAPPRPEDLTARVFQEGTIRIPVPLTGIDDDGDGVTLLGIDQAPGKGYISAQGADWLEYSALEGELGTDTFTYAVEDWVGQRAVATIRVGIAPRPATPAQVIARNDDVTVRPGTSVSVRVLANDVDSSGGDLDLEDVLVVPEGVDAQTDGRRVLVRAPDDPGVVQIVYSATNQRGGRDSAVLTVTVAEDATMEPPIARDVVVPASETLNALSVEVDVLEVADNPSGPLSDLAVSVDRSAAAFAQVTPRGTIVVTLGENPMTLPYVLTNTSPEAAGARAYAFITVPALGDFPPILRPGAPRLQALAGEPLTISLAEQIQVAPGRTVRLTDVTAVTATKSESSPGVNDRLDAVVYTPQRSYAGPASVTVRVSDGGPLDATARTAVLTLPVTVLAAEDHPPRFTPSVLDVAPGETTRVDLQAFTSTPLDTAGGTESYAYRLTSTPPPGLTAALTGSTLTLAAADTLERGTVGGIGLEIEYGASSTLAVEVDYRVVASSRALARVVDRVVPDGVAGQARTFDVLTGAYNPFPGTPLQVVSADVETPGSGTAEVAATGSVTVRPAEGFIGPMVVRFAVRDATDDPDRQVDGRLTVVVRGVPEAPTAPRVTEVRDGTVMLAWDAPATNGEPILGYQVSAGTGGPTTDCPATTCTIIGLTNGTEYRFTVTARNAVGTSASSPASQPARPDAKPAAPAAPSASAGDGALTASWTAPVTTGTPIREYQVEISPAPGSGPSTVSTSSTSYSFGGLANGTQYMVRVRALNDAPDPGDWSAWSLGQVPAGPPAAPGDVAATRAAVGGGQQQIIVTWTAADGNGAAVSGYDVRVDGDVSTVPGTQTSWSFPAQRGQQYTIEVRAVNRVGSSSWASTTGEIWSAPGPVTGLEVTDDGGVAAAFGQGAVAVTWTAPADTGGVALNGYRVTLDGSTTVDLSAGATTTRFAGLAGGLHTVAVVAINVRGAESAPATASGSSTTVPAGTVVLEPADTGVPGQVTFRWAAVTDAGGSPVTGYHVVVSGDRGRDVDTTQTGTDIVVSGQDGETLTIVVRAVNDEGESVASAPVTAVVVAVPPAGGP
jgi:hypothetical protein